MAEEFNCMPCIYRFTILLRNLSRLNDTLKGKSSKRAKTDIDKVRDAISLLEMRRCLSEDTLKELRKAVNVIEENVEKGNWDYAEDYFHDYLDITGLGGISPNKVLYDITTVCRKEIETGKPFEFKK